MVATGATSESPVALPAGELRFYRVLAIEAGAPEGPQPGEVAVVTWTGGSINAVATWATTDARIYQVEFSADLFADPLVWTWEGTPVTATGSLTEVNVGLSVCVSRLYRGRDVTDEQEPGPGTSVEVGVTLTGPGTADLTWASVAGRQYRIEFTTDLFGGAINWSQFGAVITAVGTTTTEEVPLPPGEIRFYRVLDVTGGVVTPPSTGVELVSQFTLQPGLTNVLLEWRSVAGRTYRAQSTTNAFATPVVWVD